MESLISAGKVRHIGISNFAPQELSNLLKHSTTKPYAHQMEMHPYLQQSEYLELHRQHGIHVTAYSPFGNTNPTYGLARKDRAASVVPPLLESELLEEISKKRGCTPAQVALKFGMERGTSVIPKSAHAERIKENVQSDKCGLKQSDLKAIETGYPVKRFNNPSKSWGVTLFVGLDDAAPETIKVSKMAGDCISFLGRQGSRLRQAISRADDL